MNHRDDYFALLGLDLECDDPARIRAAVARKRTECARDAMVGRNKAGCEQILAKLPEIERSLLDAATRGRVREAARRVRSAACDERLKAFQDDLSMLLSGGRKSITQQERDHLLETCARPEGPTRKELSALIVVPVERAKAGAARLATPLPAYEAKEIARNLKVLENVDLYEFLGLPPTASAAQIKARREELTRMWTRKAQANAEKSAAQTLLGKVGTLLLNPAKRASYAATLRSSRFAPLRQALKLALLDGHLSVAEHTNLLERARRLGLSTEEAEQAIREEALLIHRASAAASGDEQRSGERRAPTSNRNSRGTAEAADEESSEGTPSTGGLSGATGLCHPVAGTLQVGSVPVLMDYKIAVLDIVEPIDDLAEVPTAKLSDWLVRVVDVESPIYLEEAERRVARAAGIMRVGHLIDAAFRAAVARAAREDVIVAAGRCLWSPHDREMKVRNRAALPVGIRMIELICDEELEWATCALLSSVGRMDEVNVPKQTMRLLGFERTSQDAERRVRAAVVRGVQAGAFARFGTSLAFVAADGTALQAKASSGPDGSRRSGVGAPLYHLAQPVVELRGAEFHALSRDYLANALREVVVVESPIHIQEASRRLANAAGLQRVGHLIGSAVSAACLALEREGRIERRGDFIWNPGSALGVRDRSEAPAYVRDVRMIAPEEIRQAAHSAGVANGSVSDDSVIAVARLLGFRRTGKDVHAAIRAALASGL